MQSLTNQAVAGKIREMADTLEAQQADGFRVRAYRLAAETVDDLKRPLEEIISEGGLEGLDNLPGIGRGIAGAIMEMMTTGRWGQLDRLTGSLEPEQLFQTLPGIGPQLAAQIHNELHVDTLEALEAAAHDGRLETVAGIGKRRAEAIRMALNARLGRRRIKPQTHIQSHNPPVEFIVDVDREYRDKAAAGTLRKIAPKRFSPAKRGFLCCIRGAATGRRRRCSRTRKHMISARPRNGWSSMLIPIASRRLNARS